MAKFLVLVLLAIAACAVHGEVYFDIEDIFSRGLLQGSSSSTTKVPQGTEKFIVTLSFSKTQAELKQDEAALKTEMVNTLFKGVTIGADDIILTYKDARRRLLAGTTVTATVTTNAATVASLSKAYSTNAAAFQTAVKSYGLTGLSSNGAATLMGPGLLAAAILAIMF